MFKIKYWYILGEAEIKTQEKKYLEGLVLVENKQ